MNQDNDVFKFDNGVTISMRGLPPAPLTWLYNTVDVICMPLQCTHWRSLLNIPDDSWLSEQYKIPVITQHIPVLLSYAEFRQRDVAGRSGAEPWLTWDAVYRYAFQTSSTSLGRLITPTAFAVLCILVLALRQIKAFLFPRFIAFGRQAALRSHGEEWIQTNQIRLVKFGEYVFRLLYHSVISIYGIWYFRDKLWWKPNQAVSVFQGYPMHEIEPGMAWYYLLQAAYNMDAFLALLQMSIVCKFQWIQRPQSSTVARGRKNGSRWQLPISIAWSPTVRGDFQEMFIHHVATNVLVIGSSALHFTRIGSMVFLVHDVSGTCRVSRCMSDSFRSHNLSFSQTFPSISASWPTFSSGSG
jgi:TLC domain